MKATVVRYQAKPERADENQALVEKVFADLEARHPAFQAFVAGIAERCDVPPVPMGATVVGGYR